MSRRARSRRGRRGWPLLPFALFLASACGDGVTPPVEFAVEPDEHSLHVGETVQLAAVGAPSPPTWSSSNANIATVEAATGLVTAVAPGTVTITAVSGSSFGSARVHVSLRPAIQLSRSTVQFEIAEGDPDPAPATVTVTNAGGGDLTNLSVGDIEYGQGQPTGWLEAELGAGTAPTDLTLSASGAGVEPGSYSAVVRIHSPVAENSPQHVVVSFRVVAGPRIALSPTQVGMSAFPGESAEATVQVTNAGELPLTGLSAEVEYASGQPTGWLAATLSADAAPADLLLVADTEGLEIGAYEAQVIVSSDLEGVTPRALPVTFTVTEEPAIQLDPASVTFEVTEGENPTPKDVAVTNAGGGTLTDLELGSIDYVEGSDGWLTADLSGTTAPATITLTAAAAELPVGTHRAVVPVMSPVAANSPLDLHVELEVEEPPAISVNPDAVSFWSFVGATIEPSEQAVSVENKGGGQLTGLSAEVTYHGDAQDWLGSPEWQNGNTTAPAVLLLRPVTGGLARGTYTATVEISSSVPGVEPREVSVTFDVSSFSVDIRPIFTTSYGLAFPRTPCSGCHTLLGSNQTDAVAHEWLMHPDSGAVLAGEPDESRVICVAAGDCTPPSGPMLLPSSAVDTLREWIRRGAPQ